MSVHIILNVMLPVVTYRVWSRCGCGEVLLALLLDHFGCSSSDLQYYIMLHHITSYVTYTTLHRMLHTPYYIVCYIHHIT